MFLLWHCSEAFYISANAAFRRCRPVALAFNKCLRRSTCARTPVLLQRDPPLFQYLQSFNPLRRVAKRGQRTLKASTHQRFTVVSLPLFSPPTRHHRRPAISQHAAGSAVHRQDAPIAAKWRKYRAPQIAAACQYTCALDAAASCADCATVARIVARSRDVLHQEPRRIEPTRRPPVTLPSTSPHPARHPRYFGERKLRGLLGRAIQISAHEKKGGVCACVRMFVTDLLPGHRKKKWRTHVLQSNSMRTAYRCCFYPRIVPTRNSRHRLRARLRVF